MSLYPLLLEPALHTMPWGGRRLQTRLNKSLPTDDPYGEAWEVHDTARVANGAHVGGLLGDLVHEYGAALIGVGNDPAEGFPLLAKWLDAKAWLSIQVHPNDEQACELEGDPRGKTESWYILDAQPGSQLVIGVQPGTTRDLLAQAIRDNRLEEIVVYAEVSAGDVLYIPAGTIHALGPGLLLYEIQQSSDKTYRLYDWGRMGLDGKPRELHIDKGCRVANLETLPPIQHTAGDKSPTVEIVRSVYFTTLLHQLNATNGTQIMLDTGGQHFHILTCAEGEAHIDSDEGSVTIGIGQTALIPACIGAYTMRGTAKVIRSFQGGE
ncbi:MAG: mannose-6-phosphate isomerase [Chloroflexi bacterium]|nr:MAG: mannose-6-phosphate isomerase [Chloroflexota bacterium]